MRVVSAMPARFASMEPEVESPEVKLQRVEALLERWRFEDREMRNSYGIPLLGGVVASCAEELSEALTGQAGRGKVGRKQTKGVSCFRKAYLDVRVFPWKLRMRKMEPDTLREFDPLLGAWDDPAGLLIGLALWVVIFVAAPLIVIVLAVLLFSVELPIVIAIALLLLVIRFVGIVPWTVVARNNINGEESRESFRNIFHAVRRIREINGDMKVRVRWSWSG